MSKVERAIEREGSTVTHHRSGQAQPVVSHDSDDEAIDEVGDESFPASDPPSSWSGGDADEERTEDHST